MSDKIHEYIGLILLLGVLFTACTSTLKKLTTLLKYVSKLFTPLKNAARRHEESPGSSANVVGLSKKGKIISICTLAFSGFMLVEDLSKTSPITRWDVFSIVMDISIVLVILFNWYLGYVTGMLISVMASIVEALDEQQKSK